MTGPATRVRRALLFMPGDDRHKIEKGARLGVDAVIMDLEDAVAPGRKDAARITVAAALREVDFGRTERLVRLNPSSGPFSADDLAATVAARPDGYVLPKVESAAEVRALDDRLSDAEAAYGWPSGAIVLLAMIETARGVVNLREIAECSPRLAALALGGEDLTADLGAARTPDRRELFFTRGALVVHAAAAGLQAIDTVYPAFDDEPGLIAETDSSRGMGFTGRFAIHPRQVEAIQRVFTPATEEIVRARRLLEAHAAHQSAGIGAFVFDGTMVDAPMFHAAEIILARARAAGLLGGEDGADQDR